ncbi:hypothetical protein [Salmonella enterica]|uniref:Uncharacterized protein n=3 Tax=Salmonella enterica TaxID=28901 RepID=A0A5T3ZC46_SALER|nr:hypothetical protein [Salmonella enterica]ECC9834456.1 hypothetical protein [Salmonella enterica subsp. enterica serovar Paratyphi A]EDE4794012.1 hypothetical protein [Salmonella enterica subsp. enterica serovar Enteritidis]EDG8911975.1 hypothetical protein [Salmonella enterica subsp. enterica serovar Typhimurium]EDY0562953.1 hypothetical protein [Salmonella enterica subsp. enterica]HAD7831272.1 hypothetical protein [Salmonella enterica subsp. enterica serovar Typhi str. 404ty]
MKTVLDTLLLIVSIAFVLDCIFTGAIRKALAPVNGAMVVDSGEQFYVVRDDRVLSSPYLTKRNGKLSGVGEDKFVYNKSGDVYGVHAKNASYLFDDCKEVG